MTEQKELEHDKCNICLDVMLIPLKVDCGLTICFQCLYDLMNTPKIGPRACPFCKENISVAIPFKPCEGYVETSVIWDYWINRGYDKRNFYVHPTCKISDIQRYVYYAFLTDEKDLVFWLEQEAHRRKSKKCKTIEFNCFLGDKLHPKLSMKDIVESTDFCYMRAKYKS